MSRMFFFFKQKTAYEMRISDWSSDVCSSDLACPSTVIEPPSIGVSALMQRMKVDLPEPEGPMTQTTSPFISSSEMPFSTWRLPNDLCTSRQRMIGWSGVQVGEEVMGEVSCQTVFWLSPSGLTRGSRPERKSVV